MVNWSAGYFVKGGFDFEDAVFVLKLIKYLLCYMGLPFV